MYYFFKYQFHILIIFVGILIYGVYYTGSNTLQAEFYLLVFFIASLLGFVLKKMNWNPIPIIIAFLVSDMAIPVVLRSLALLKSYL
jgi:TctA family transporter